MPREIKVENHLSDRTEAIGGLCLKLNPLWYTGIPDRILLLPGGIVIFVETKRPKSEGGRLGKKQPWWHNMLRALGFRVEVIWSIEQVDNMFRSL